MAKVFTKCLQQTEYYTTGVIFEVSKERPDEVLQKEERKAESERRLEGERKGKDGKSGQGKEEREKEGKSVGLR